MTKSYMLKISADGKSLECYADSGLLWARTVPLINEWKQHKNYGVELTQVDLNQSKFLYGSIEGNLAIATFEIWRYPALPVNIFYDIEGGEIRKIHEAR